LKDVVMDTYPTKLANYLSDYIRARQLNRIEDDRKGDFVGSTEINNELKDRSIYVDIS